MSPPGPKQLPLLTPRPEGRRACVSLDASVGLPPLVRVDVAGQIIWSPQHSSNLARLDYISHGSLALLFGSTALLVTLVFALSPGERRTCRRPSSHRCQVSGGQAPFELRGGFFTLGFLSVPWLVKPCGPGVF